METTLHVLKRRRDRFVPILEHMIAWSDGDGEETGAIGVDADGTIVVDRAGVSVPLRWDELAFRFD